MRHTCSHTGCSHLAVERCFDCGAYLCATHTAAIQVRTYKDTLREIVCATCLQTYLAEPGPFGPALLLEQTVATLDLPGVTLPDAPLADDGLHPGIAPAGA